MSGLEKFSRRESAICRLKQFLLQERAPPSRESFNSSNESNESIQLDLDQSFQKILNAHREKKTVGKGNSEDKENLHQIACDNNVQPSLEQTTDFQSATCSTIYASMNDTTLLGSCLDDSDSDISFNELERMCNKTLSDPDNTIHQYLAGQLKARDMRRVSESKDESQDTLALLEAIDQHLAEQRIISDEQLYDVEAPSFLWNSTIAGDVSDLRIVTPAKSVKFQPIAKSISEESLCELAEVTLNLYESIQVDSQPEVEAKTMLIALDDTISESYKTGYETFNSDKESSISSSASISTTVDQEKVISERSVQDSSMMLDRQPPSDLDGTFYVTPKRTSEDSIIYISDDENEITIVKDVEHSDCGEIRPEINENSISPKAVIYKSEPDPPFPDVSVESEERHEFNNTLEEVDYIMKQGIKYLAANPKIPSTIDSKYCLSPSPMSSPQTPNTVIKIPQTQKLAHNLKQEEKPKRDEFKRPRQFTRIPKPSAIKNIVSPVGAYIRHTPITPLMTSYKPSASNSLSSKAARGLKYEVTKEGISRKVETPVSSLPKKAYISSSVKHVVDERKANHLPGGEKIHRHLVTAKTPTVIHHQGKIKSNAEVSESRARLQYEANSSLANLSTVSGDISVHVLKDARR